MTPRFHLFPFRTQKLSLVVPKILGWRRPGKIGRCRLFSLFGEKPAFSPKYGPLVKRLRRRPLTAKSGVRFSQGSPFLCSAPHLLRLFCTFSSVGRATVKHTKTSLKIAVQSQNLEFKSAIDWANLFRKVPWRLQSYMSTNSSVGRATVKLYDH